MRVGSMFLGEVENVDHESIQTKFLIIGLPIAPLESLYVTEDHGNGVQGIPIELHGASVAAGYVRLLSAMGAAGTGLFAWLEWSSWDPQWGLAFTSVALAAVWLASLFGLGRVSEAERGRRRRLRQVTGLGAPPELLPAHTRADLQLALEARWDELGLGDWRDRLMSGEASDVELDFLYVLAEYEGDTDLAQFARIGLAA